MYLKWMYFVILASPLFASAFNVDPLRPQYGKCIMPEYPANGTYITDIPDAKPGDAYESVTINITCGQGFGVSRSDYVQCRDGSWTDKISKCIPTHCHLPSHPSVEYRCLVSELTISSRICKEYEPVGTRVFPQCRSPIYYTTSPLEHMLCDEGKWNYIAKCTPECGTVTLGSTELVINGVSAKRAEVPWHAGIYTKTTRPYQQICGGSLIRNNIVISAAHCFWSNIMGKLPAADYAVAVGKLYRPWIDTREEAQQSDVKKIHLTDLFQGSAAHFQDDIAVLIVTDPFEYTAHIRPVCIDFDAAFQERQLKTGHKGKVAGWGLTSGNGDPSQVLKVIELPYITTKQCISESPTKFHAYITRDKMCAGYKEAGKALCRGDSGGGLAFPGTKDKDIERYYLRGIVSTSPSNNNLCNANTYMTFTLLLKHEHFVKHYLTESATRKTGDRSGARPVNQNVVQTFVDHAASPPAPFQHLTVDRNTGRVYIGALNRIHQLTPDLERTQWIITGPVEDSYLWFPPYNVCPANILLELTDNTNKVLVIDYVTDRLISCGSVFQGMCSVRNLSNMSLGVLEVEWPVVGHDAASSSVAFIAPGPPNAPISRVLYVGTSYMSNINGNLFNVRYVGSHSLENGRLFNYAAATKDTRTCLNILSLDPPVDYVYGFSSEGFSYFLTTEKLTANLYVSMLIRVCHYDKEYYSYTSVPIACIKVRSGNYTNYNLAQAAFVGKASRTLATELGISTQDDVLFAAFSESETIDAEKPSNRSALCVYSLKTIRRTFTKNIKRCFSGIGSAKVDSIRFFPIQDPPAGRCIAMELQIDEDFCGLKLNWPLIGELSVVAKQTAVFDTRLTALAVATAGDLTVVFAGTADGYLKKILVDNSSSAFEYGAIDVDEGSPINKDLIFDTQLTHLYVMTERRVSKVRVQECNEYKSCQECLEANDPYCGWGIFENKCSLHPHAQNATQNSLQWISYRTGRCPTITEVTPYQLQRSTPKTLELFIQNLPTYKAQFVCVFTTFGRNLVTNATRTSSGVSCDTPRTDTLPAVPETQNHFTTRLSVRTAQGSDVVATEFKFFDCNTYSSCTQCVTSPFPCGWCLDRNRCTHDVIEHCRHDSLVVSVSKTDSNTSMYNSGSIFCPAFNSSSTNDISLFICLIMKLLNHVFT